MSSIGNLLKIIERSEAKFVSLKYFDAKGVFRQVDVAAKSLIILDDFILVNNLKLQPIDNKCFVDPFRSYPTIFCLCDNLTDQHNPRIFLKDNILASNDLPTISLELAVNFLVLDREERFENYQDQGIDCQNQVEPLDKLVNLRAEIVGMLEKISIPTISHFHASKSASCSIVIKADNLLDLADYSVIANFIIKNVAESYGKSVYFIDELNNELFLLFPESKYNKELAIHSVSGIMPNSEGNKDNIFFTKRLKREIEEKNVLVDYYFHDTIRNYHKISLNLRHNSNIYLALSYLLIYGFNIKLINGNFSKGILQSYFGKDN
ncbi:MAG: hypothetical protein RCG15_01675 [Candidatus Rickettsia vulgarisii]